MILDTEFLIVFISGIVLRRTKSVERLSFDQKSVTSSEASSADIHPSNDRPKRRSSSVSENSEEMQTAFRGDEEKNKVLQGHHNRLLEFMQ